MLLFACSAMFFFEAVGISFLVPGILAVFKGSLYSLDLMETLDFIWIPRFVSTPTELIVVGIIFIVLKSCIKYCFIYIQAHLSFLLTERVRTEFINALFHADSEIILRDRSGKYSNMFMGEVTRSLQGFQVMTRVVSGLIGAIIFVTLALLLNSIVTLFMVGLVATSVLTFYPLMTKSKKLSSQSVLLNNQLNTTAIEAVGSIGYLRATARAPWVLRICRESILRTASIQRRMTIILGIFESLKEILVILILIVVVVVADTVFALSIEIISSLLALLYKAAISLMGFQGGVHKALDLSGSSIALAQEIRKLENIQETGFFSESISSDDEKLTNVRAENLSISIGSRLLFEGLSFSVDRGEILLIDGQSGSGKSTLLKVLAREKSYSGKIAFNGCAIEEMPRNANASRLGYLPQNPILFPGSIYENFACGSQIGELEERYILDLLDKIGLSRLLACEDSYGQSEYLLQMSGGEKQRLCAARELFKKPELLLLDEPTSNLDRHSEELLLETILEVREDMIIVIASHSSECRKIATKSLNLHNFQL